MDLRNALLLFLIELGVLAPSSSSSSHDDNQHDASASSLSSSSASSSAAYGIKKKRNDTQQKKKLHQLHDPSPSSELTNRQDHRFNGDGSTGSDASKKKQDIGYLDHRHLSEDPRLDETFQRHRELESREDYCANLCPSERQEIQDNGAFKSLINSGNYASIGCWNTSVVTDMSEAFYYETYFNENINCWDVSSVTDMYRMFDIAYNFDQPLNGWNVASVERMTLMFQDTQQFDQPLNDWNVSKVADMSFMFNYLSKFNQPLDAWDVARVTNMEYMFSYTENFNQPVDDWDVARVSSMSHMFYKSENFNQCISSWAGKRKTPPPVDTKDMFDDSGCPLGDPNPRSNDPWCRNYDCVVTTSAPTSSPTTSLAPTSSPTTSLAPTIAPTSVPTASPTGACDNSADFDCAKHVTGFKKRKCSKKIRKKWGVGLKFKDVCREMCKGQLCTCVDSLEKFSIKGVEGDHTCAGLIGRTNCKKFTDNGFGVNKICPNQCQNTKKCINQE